MFKRKRDEKVKPRHALQEAIGFTVEDLETNDGGKLSQTQSQMLKRDFTRLFLFNLALIMLYVLTYKGYQSGAKSSNDIGSSILLSLLLLPFFLFTLNKWVRYLLDVINGAVGKSEGTIELDIHSNRGGNHYKLQTQGMVFELSKSVFLAFKNNEPYLIYFAPYSKTIVSAEWLHDSAE